MNKQTTILYDVKIYSMKNKIMIFGMTIFEYTDSIEIEK